ncbi:MAG: dihydrolipoyl dehydrogenase [Planctomycetes bacterium]|nr:dihydrolipoyl dehydrogenase [Planctomycetota bacterium]
MAKHELVVIGAGPGGYVAAIRAAQLGFDVACVEKEPALGGTCLRIGCIPSKALLESSELYHEARHSFGAHGVKVGGVELDLATLLARKDRIVDGLTKGVAGLFKKNRVTRYQGHARFVSPTELAIESSRGVETVQADHVIVATGSVSASLAGVELDGDRIGTSTEALSWPAVPRSLVVIGAGAIGLELGSVWARLGAEVTVLEYLERILPGMDSELAREAQKIFEKQGLRFRLGARVQSAKRVGDECVVEIAGAEPLHAERVLLAAGRRPNTTGLGLESLGLELDAKGRIPVDEHYRTKLPSVSAIGDVISGPMLAHKAEEEGVACVEFLKTGFGHVHYDAIPSIVYTAPEVASVGKTEEELVAAGVPFKKGSFPFLANGRAKALGQTEGRVKILVHERTDRILGVHVLGARAGELIAEAAVAIEFGASGEDLARTCHAHPTLSEIVKEAALATQGRAIHI